MTLNTLLKGQQIVEGAVEIQDASNRPRESMNLFLQELVFDYLTSEDVVRNFQHH